MTLKASRPGSPGTEGEKETHTGWIVYNTTTFRCKHRWILPGYDDGDKNSDGDVSRGKSQPRTVLQRFAGDDLRVDALSHHVVGGHAHLIVTAGVQAAKLRLRGGDVQHLRLGLRVPVDPVLHLGNREGRQRVGTLEMSP